MRHRCRSEFPSCSDDDDYDYDDDDDDYTWYSRLPNSSTNNNKYDLFEDCDFYHLTLHLELGIT